MGGGHPGQIMPGPLPGPMPGPQPMQAHAPRPAAHSGFPTGDPRPQCRAWRACRSAVPQPAGMQMPQPMMSAPPGFTPACRVLPLRPPCRCSPFRRPRPSWPSPAASRRPPPPLRPRRRNGRSMSWRIWPAAHPQTPLLQEEKKSGLHAADHHRQRGDGGGSPVVHHLGRSQEPGSYRTWPRWRRAGKDHREHSRQD